MLFGSIFNNNDFTGEKKMSEDTVKAVRPDELADFCMKCADEKMATDIIRLDLGESSSVADHYVVCTANSEPQMRAVAGFVERQVRDVYGQRPLSENGESMSGWSLIDFGSVLVHVMTAEVRDRYNLEGLWGDKPSADALRKLAEHQK